MVRGGVIYCIFSDQLGSPIIVFNTSTGAIAEQTSYGGLLPLAREAPAVLPDDWTAYAEAVIRAVGPERGMNRRIHQAR
jgi:hypothetical protein